MDRNELAEKFNRRGEYSESRHVYLVAPDKLYDMPRLIYQGQQAARYIAEARAMIETMEAYQQLLYDRVQLLETAPYHLEIILKRERRYDGKVWYWLTLQKVREVDCTEPEILDQKKYPGSERHAALKAFSDYQKTHPGIVAIKDIQKSAWER